MPADEIADLYLMLDLEAAYARRSFNRGLAWGVAVSVIGFWLPVAAYLLGWV